ncbi:MAG: ABC transporter substrate-binding protein [Chloroflexota bacterium]
MTQLTRRHLNRSLMIAGAGAMLPRLAAAQDATPEAEPAAAATGETIVSATRDEWTAAFKEAKGLSAPEGPGGTFLDAGTSDLQSLQPFLAEEADTLGVVGLIYDSLVGGDPDTGKPAPTALADYWEIAPDGRTYTFHLNQDAMWHDGQPVTAEDVVFSFDALADETTGSVYTASFVDAVESWRAIDEHTVEMVAKEPRFDFLYSLVAFIVPKHIWGEVPFAEWATDPGATGEDPSRVVGSGPFRFGEWKQGESVTLVRNDDYYGEVPYLEQYTRVIWPDQTAVLNAFLNSEIDVTSLEPADVPQVEGQEGISIYKYPTRGFTYLEFNLDTEVTTMFEDARVRQAMMYALDRQSVVDDILLGYAEVANGPQPVVSYAYAPDEMTTKYGFDPEKAKALLAEAGWTDSDGDGIVDKDGVAMSFEYLYSQGSPTSDQIAAYVQDAWKAVGIDAQPRALEFPALIEATTTDPSFAVAAYGFSWDATFIQDAMFGCEQYQVGFNDMRYCNPGLDEINAEAKITFDDEQRRALLVEASDIVNEELPVLVLHFSTALVAAHDRVQNYQPNTWGGVPINYLWIQE